MAKGLLIIKTLTPTHAGAGTSLGAIDLLLQREVTTEFPFIQASTLKGSIRAHLERQPINDKDLAQRLIDLIMSSEDNDLKEEVKNLTPDKMTVFKARTLVQKIEKSGKEVKEFKQLYQDLDKVFGSYDPDRGVKKGSLVISDASLLFYPVRSLKGLYALVTCPEILRRLNMPHINLGIPDNLLDIREKGIVKALSSTTSSYEINERIYFEDLNFSVETLNDNDLNWIKEKLGLDEGIKVRLFIVHDDIFRYFVKFATQVMSRNKIDYNTGTVDKKIGGIWTEEHLPPETYLFSYLEDNGNLVDGSQTGFKWLESKFNSSNVIHLGRSETVGKGFVELRFKGL